MDTIRFRERLGYGFGDLASNLGNASLSWFAMYYYVNIVHIKASTVGTMMLVVMLLDSVTDVIVGILVDKTHTRYGKARPWLLRMFLPFAIMFTLMFSVPDTASGSKVVYAFLTLLLFNLTYSAINIPYGILNSLITQNQYQRSVLNAFRMFMAFGSTILVSSLTLKVVGFFGGGHEGWHKTALFYAALSGILFLCTFLITRERVDSGNTRENVPLARSLKALMNINCWWNLVIYAFFLYIFYSINSTATVYYAQNILKSTNIQSTITFAFYLPIVLGMLTLAPLIKRFGKRNLTIAGIVTAFLGTLVMFTNMGNSNIVVLSTIIKGIGMAPILGCFYAMAPDIIEYGEWKTGVRSEGLIYSATSFGIKIGGGIGSAIVGWGLSIGGYSTNSAVQSGTALFSIRFMYIVLPLLLFVIMIFVLLRYKLDKIYKVVEHDLAVRSN